MRRYRRLSFVLLCLLLVPGLTACGTFEINVEMPGQAVEPAASTVAVPVAVSATPRQPEMTPTPVPVDYGRSIAEPAFTPVPVDDYPAPAGLRVAFGWDDQIWLWTAETGEAVALASRGSTEGDVRISSDGAIVAFQRGDALWAVDSDGSGARQLLGRDDFAAMGPAEPGFALNRFEWVPDTHSLAFNTRLLMPHGTVLNDDLHLVDADTLEQVMLLQPGEGGEFYYSPDGRHIAVVTAGDISLIDADGQNRRDRVLTYTPVNTASEYRFYAWPRWAPDGGALRVAIPPVEPHARPAQTTSLWHIPADGSLARLMTSINTAPGLWPDSQAFSPDLAFVAYVQARQPENATSEQIESWLEVRRLANGDVQAYANVNAFLRWAPDSQHFAFMAGGESPRLHIGQWSGATSAGSVDPGTPVYNLRWVDAGHYLFAAGRSTGRGEDRARLDLVLADIQGGSTILASMSSLPSFDSCLR